MSDAAVGRPRFRADGARDVFMHALLYTLIAVAYLPLRTALENHEVQLSTAGQLAGIVLLGMLLMVLLKRWHYGASFVFRGLFFIVIAAAAQLAYMGGATTVSPWLLSGSLFLPLYMGLLIVVFFASSISGSLPVHYPQSERPFLVTAIFSGVVLCVLGGLVAGVLRLSHWPVEAASFYGLWTGLICALGVGLSFVMLSATSVAQSKKRRPMAVGIAIVLTSLFFFVVPMGKGPALPRYLDMGGLASVSELSASRLGRTQWQELEALRAAGFRDAMHEEVRLAILNGAGPELLRRLCKGGGRTLRVGAHHAEAAPNNTAVVMVCEALGLRFPEAGADILEHWLAETATLPVTVRGGGTKSAVALQRLASMRVALYGLAGDLWLEVGLIAKALHCFTAPEVGVPPLTLSNAALIGLWTRHRLGEASTAADEIRGYDPLLVDLLSEKENAVRDAEAIWGRWKSLVALGFREPERSGFIRTGQPGFAVPYTPHRSEFARALRVRTRYASGFSWRLPPTPRFSEPALSWPVRLRMQVRVARDLSISFFGMHGRRVRYSCVKGSEDLPMNPKSDVCGGEWSEVVIEPLRDWRQRYGEDVKLDYIEFRGDFAFTNLAVEADSGPAALTEPTGAP